ncbi:MAG: hypothetical protein GF320_15780 [Armatimonadia bacterium]|nr:hypothetical protein [Armatimonadia bacterium]
MDLRSPALTWIALALAAGLAAGCQQDAETDPPPAQGAAPPTEAQQDPEPYDSAGFELFLEMVDAYDSADDRHWLDSYALARAIRAGDEEAIEEFTPIVRQRVEANREALALLERLADMEWGVPQQTGDMADLAGNMADVFPKLADARSIARLVGGAAALHHLEGRDAEAIALLEDAYAGTAGLTHGGTVMYRLAYVSIVGILAESELALLMDGLDVSADALRAHAARLSEIRHSLGTPAEMIRAEKRMSASAWDESVTDDMTPEEKATLEGLGDWAEEHYEEAARLAELPPAESGLAEYAAKVASDPTEAGGAKQALVGMLEVLPKAHVRHHQMLAQLVGVETVLLLRAHHKEHGEWPQSLDDLGAEIPSDPWTGGPVHYRPTPEGGRPFALYLTGPDGVDDGGTSGGEDRLEPDHVLVPWPIPWEKPAPPESTEGRLDMGMGPNVLE